MIGFLTWQEAFGLVLVGFILGFGSAVVLSNYLIRQRRKEKDRD